MFDSDRYIRHVLPTCHFQYFSTFLHAWRIYYAIDIRSASGSHDCLAIDMRFAYGHYARFLIMNDESLAYYLVNRLAIDDITCTALPANPPKCNALNVTIESVSESSDKSPVVKLKYVI